MMWLDVYKNVFFFNDTATTEIYTLSLHDALPISGIDMISKDKIISVADQLGNAAGAERVLLFGSHARGEAHELSDVDLLIIAESDLPRFKRSRELYKLIKPYPFAMDIVVYTPEEIKKGKRTSVSFVSSVLKYSETVYERKPGNRTAMAG